MASSRGVWGARPPRPNLHVLTNEPLTPLPLPQTLRLREETGSPAVFK
jgi:hypothetical protein